MAMEREGQGEMIRKFECARASLNKVSKTFDVSDASYICLLQLHIHTWVYVNYNYW